jgi:hypothetical protein
MHVQGRLLKFMFCLRVSGFWNEHDLCLNFNCKEGPSHPGFLPSLEERISLGSCLNRKKLLKKGGLKSFSII